MNDPRSALDLLLGKLAPVPTETASSDAAKLSGRVLAAPIGLDRDSPACDVSAMDGFAVRLAELEAGPLPLAGECRIGQAPASVAPGTAKRIYTGSPLPDGADTVLRLERGDLEGDRLTLKPGASVSAGADIRRQGENAEQGEQVLPAGIQLTPAAIGAIATVGSQRVELFRRLRVAVITTGDELVGRGESTDELPAWRIRDSNGPVLQSLLGALPFVEKIDHRHADDSLDAVADELRQAVADYDAVVLTGGVSKGAYDYVPPAVERIGGEIVFHRIKARPGQPTLGAVIGETPVVGLPGNPLAVMCAGRRLVVPMLRQRAGLASPVPPPATVALNAWPGKTLPITWWRAVTLVEPGVAQIAALKGSGDVCGPATTDGFVEVSPETSGTGPFAYYPWTP